MTIPESSTSVAPARAVQYLPPLMGSPSWAFKSFSHATTDGLAELAKDAFLQDWKAFEPCFACPPPKLIGATIRHFVGVEAAGGLIVPLWLTSPAWPLLCEDGVHLNRFVQSWRIVRPYVTKGPAVQSDTFSGFTKFPFLSLQIHGAIPRPFASRIDRAFCTLFGCAKCL